MNEWMEDHSRDEKPPLFFLDMTVVDTIPILVVGVVADAESSTKPFPYPNNNNNNNNHVD